MAAVHSLGLHRPSALDYLIRESLLPPDLNANLYSWNVYTDGGVEEELLSTKSCVVWSRGRIVRRLFNFEIEQENVHHAMLAWFPAHEDTGTQVSHSEKAPQADKARQSGDAREPRSKGEASHHNDLARALVVFLKYQAHIFFLSGASHIVSLLFEVERAFPAPRGLVIQRKLASPVTGPRLSHLAPSVPQNSFLSPLGPASSRHFPSFLAKKGKPSDTGALPELDFSLLQSPAVPNEDGMPRHFSLTSPLSELALVVRTPNPNDPRSGSLKAAKSLPALEVEEELLYISPTNEIPTDTDEDAEPLLLAVTLNQATGLYSVWHVSYLHSKPVSALLTGRSTPTTTTGAKSRRRSSFVTPTGASTPVARPRESMRESLGATRNKAAAGTVKKAANKKKDKKSLKAAEDALASQVDPGFEPRHTARESRRVSSMLARADLNPSFDRNAFQDLASQGGAHNSFGRPSRRGQSLGANSDRQSLGAGAYGRLRASTPGAFSRLSIDDLSEADSNIQSGWNGSQASTTLDDFERYADLLGDREDLDELNFHHPLDGLKKELLVRKIGEISARSTAVSPSKSNRGTEQRSPLDARQTVFTLPSPINTEEQGYYGRRFFLFIYDRTAKECIQVEFSVRVKRATPEVTMDSTEVSSLQQARSFPVPSFRNVTRIPNVVDAVSLSNDAQSRVLFLKESRGTQPSFWIFSPWSGDTRVRVPLRRLRVFNPYDVSPISTSPRSVGVRRTTNMPQKIAHISRSGLNEAIDIFCNNKEVHQVQLRLWPKNTTIAKILTVCIYALPLSLGEKLLALWWNRFSAYQKAAQSEWHALATSLLAIFLSCEDERRSRRVQRRLTESLDSSTPNAISTMKLLSSSWNQQSSLDQPAWAWTRSTEHTTDAVTSSPQSLKESPMSPSRHSRETFAHGHVAAARSFVSSGESKEIMDSLREQRQTIIPVLARLMITLHLLREEAKLSNLSGGAERYDATSLTPVLAQMGRWLGWSDWDWKPGKYYFYELQSCSYAFEDSPLFQDTIVCPPGFELPPSVLEWVEVASTSREVKPMPTLDLFLHGSSTLVQQHALEFTPRTSALKRFFAKLHNGHLEFKDHVEAMIASKIDSRFLETCNESILVMLKESIVQCQHEPPTTWPSSLLSYVSREDLELLLNQEKMSRHDGPSSKMLLNEGIRDLHTITQSTESVDQFISFPNSDRMSVSRLIFSQDRRFTEAVHMIEPYRVAVAECIPMPTWTEAQVLEAQQEVHKWVMIRTFSLAPGLGFTHYDSRVPLLSEKFNIPGYNTLCVMKPMNNTQSADRSAFTEDRYAWAWFHSGVAAGLSISKHADGIDSSWVVFNRPGELNNRHAGLLLALGLNGHLRSMAKWLAFKYLTPKHTMTSIGLLLGLSASHLGTMDTLVTRLLSVHVTRMLPPGAAELNLSALTQTAGLMGIGLLYYNTQHRRMSEVMLSEIENLEVEDPSGTSEPIRDESYRLAAGFALGLINLGQGSDLKGLHDLRLVERLLAVAVGPRPVDLIHLMDQATAGATVAIMLIFMKTGNKAVARKIDIPDTVPQFDFVRPDILLLRTLAKHVILWKDIRADQRWISKNIPRGYAKLANLHHITTLRSDHMPFYNILAGLLWSISLRFAGSGDLAVRDFLVGYLDQFMRICRLSALRYDSMLTRNTVRNCQDLVALGSATVMAGTGDLNVFRRLRSLHGRVNPETPYGSHMAAHMALGALFFGAGCYTFGTSNLAIAALTIAFYPVFPVDVTDNKAHLQAFRHFWALAAEARCIIPRDIDTQRTINLEIMVHGRDGKTQRMTAPQLLPDLETISKITTVSSEYWPVTLDFANNAAHLEAFRRNQTLHVRRRPTHEAHTSVFTCTLVALNEARSASKAGEWIFRLDAFRQFEKADVGIFLEPEDRGGASLDLRGTAVDERLLINEAAEKGWDRDRLWNLRILLRWADRRSIDGTADLKWIRKEVLDRWKAMIEERARQRGP